MISSKVSLFRIAISFLAGIAALFLSLPILILCWRAIEGAGWASSTQTGITAALTLSIITTALSSLITLIFGTPLAYTLAGGSFPFKRLVEVFVELPIILPPAVAGIALLATLGRRGILGAPLYELGIALPFTTAAVVLAQVFVSAPFYIRAAQLGFRAVPTEIIHAARVDGASEWALFRRIMLPLSRRALLAGLVISWARALGEFGATILFAGSLQGRTQTMPLFIYNVLERDADAALWAGAILVVMALGALLLAQYLQRGAGVDEPSA